MRDIWHEFWILEALENLGSFNALRYGAVETVSLRRLPCKCTDANSRYSYWISNLGTLRAYVSTWGPSVPRD